jgi:hypothetical protein
VVKNSQNSTLSWLLIVLYIMTTCLLAVGGAGKILNIAFPGMSLVLAIFLYYKNPVMYVGFSWWILFLTPFIRRVADYYSGFTEQSPILLGQYMVYIPTLITFYNLLKNFSTARWQNALPFLLAFFGVFYSYCIGLLSRSFLITTKGCLDWLLPVTFGYYLFSKWREYDVYRDNTYKVFTWSTLVMGAYGILQFMALPEWDRQWIINSEFTASGDPDSGVVRIWSTLNSGEPFTAVIAATVLVLITYRSPLSFAASILGIAALIATSIRSGWLGFVCGLLTLGGSLSEKHQIRFLALGMVLILCALPILTLEPFSSTFLTRFSTFSDLSNDVSAQGRQEALINSVDSIIQNPIGDGINTVSLDSALLSCLFYLGWIGGIPYLFSIFLGSMTIFSNDMVKRDPFIASSRAAIVSVLARFLLNAANAGASGVVLWAFIGLGLASIKFYSQQNERTKLTMNC